MKIDDVINESNLNLAEGVESKGPWLNNKTNKWVAWYKKDSKSDAIIISADSEEEARTQLEVALDKIQSRRPSNTGITPGQNLHKQEVTSVGFNSAFVSGVLRMSGQTFFAQFNDGKLLVSTNPAPGFRKVSKVVPSPTGTFSKNDIQNAGLNLSQRYDITPVGQSDSGISIFKLSHHSDVSHANDRVHRQTPSLTIHLAGRNTPQQGMEEGSLEEEASKLLSAQDKDGIITIIVQAPDGTKRSASSSNPNAINKWLMKYGLRLPKNIADLFVGVTEEFRPTTGQAMGIRSQIARKMNPGSNKFVWKRPNQIAGSHTENELRALKFRYSAKHNVWGGTPQMWSQLEGVAESDVEEGIRVPAQQILGTKNRAQSAYYPTNVKPKVPKLATPLTDKELARLSQLAGIDTNK